MRKPAMIRDYAFLLHDLCIVLPISEKRACGAPATGFTQKRHTLYAYYNRCERKFQIFFSENFYATGTNSTFRSTISLTPSSRAP